MNSFSFDIAFYVDSHVFLHNISQNDWHLCGLVPSPLCGEPPNAGVAPKAGAEPKAGVEPKAGAAPKPDWPPNAGGLPKPVEPEKPAEPNPAPKKKMRT